jgi:dTDP-4-dehydrorhamnose 3,5-epimerase
MKMSVTRFSFTKITEINSLQIITPLVAPDDRGVLTKVFECNIFHNEGIDFQVHEILETTSRKGVLRGLHMQHTRPQGKLVRVVSGSVYDVAVDVRKGSKTFGQYFGVYLTGENRKMFYIPEGFLHGFLALENHTVFNYLCSQDFVPQDDRGVQYNDPDINIQWPVEMVGELILSNKDLALPTLRGFTEK